MPETRKTEVVAAYIEKAPDWSKDLCRQLQTIILAADPAIKEEWKWDPITLAMEWFVVLVLLNSM